ncbi:MAG TPA: GH25 family lysozyme, partial [Candidatus Angelobacter sp.]|nr:GH25 family lysozyme [Candidatus Angelobacter sp.]
AVAGATINDPCFEQNWKGATAAGVIPGAYGFAYPQTSSAHAEAEALHNAVVRVGGWSASLGPAIDIEPAGCDGIDRSTLTQWVRDWLDRIMTLSGIQGRIYGSPDFLANALDSTQFTDTELWIAHYGVPHPDDCGAWKMWTFWQHTSDGSVSGINGRVDLNYFAGTLEQLRSRFMPEHMAVSHHQGGEDVQVPELREGVKGHNAAVKAIQGAVGAKPVDGIFGKETDVAVRRFQKAHRLVEDGVVGDHTWREILK